jgi:trehalose 6-phosphate phosphatase
MSDLNHTTADDPSAARLALFLDVDGTLLEIAATPESVYVPDDLRALLVDLDTHFKGAVALISGRSIADLDALFAPLRLCAAGVHGCERREASGRIVRPDISAEVLSEARSELQRFVTLHPGLLLEDKGFGLALHYRLAPQLGVEVIERMQRICRSLGPQFTLQAGKLVLEIRPAGFTKGTSIAALMQQAPFKGRTPIFMGDDITDEDGFKVVNDLGGLSIKVGDAPTTLAQRRLRGVDEARQWLRQLTLVDDAFAW